MLGLHTVHRLSLLAVNGSYSLTAVRGLLLAVASLMEQRLWGMKSSVAAVLGLSSCGPRALSTGATVVHTGSVAPWQMGSSPTRD